MTRSSTKRYLQLEMITQLQRLKYALATTKGWTYCPFPPRKIAIEASSFCNLRCIHCAHGESENGGERLVRTKSNMKFDLYKKIVDEASKFSNSTKLVFALMGEPLMNKRIVDMIAYAHSKGVWTQVNTNCMLLNKDKGRELIEAGLDFIYMSLDGITQETYERIRVRGDFNRVINNILDMIELKYEMGAFDLTIQVGMTAEIINQNELDIFVREFNKLPIDAAYSPLLFNWNGAIEWANDRLQDLQTADRSQWPVCNTAYDIVAISSNGDFLPCIYDHEGKYSSGNVGEESILTLWNNARTRLFRRALHTHDYDLIEEQGPLCSQCTICWNPHYQIDSSLGKALGKVAQHSRKAWRDYRQSPQRHKSQWEKYLFLAQHREEFLNSLKKAQTPEEKYYYNLVQSQGVLEVRC